MTFNSLYTLPGQHLLLLFTLVVIHGASSGFLQSLVSRLFERFFQVPPIPSLVMLHLQLQAFFRAPSQAYCPTNPQNSWCCNLKAIFLLTMAFGQACHLPFAGIASSDPLQKTLKNYIFCIIRKWQAVFKLLSFQNDWSDLNELGGKWKIFQGSL